MVRPLLLASAAFLALIPVSALASNHPCADIDKLAALGKIRNIKEVTVGAGLR